MERLAGKCAIVTGAASGIGAEIARLFAAESASVALLDVNGAGAQAVAREIDAKAFECDVTDPARVAQSVGEAIAALGGLDILVNAAGVLVRQPYETIDVDMWQRLFEINLRGPSLVIQVALPALRDSADASIINIASYSALMPSPGTSAYAATKGGLMMLGKCLVETPMTDGSMADPETHAQVRDSNALKTVGQPLDIASAAVYLASAESRFMTGSRIVLDGGSAYA